VHTVQRADSCTVLYLYRTALHCTALYGTVPYGVVQYGRVLGVCTEYNPGTSYGVLVMQDTVLYMRIPRSLSPHIDAVCPLPPHAGGCQGLGSRAAYRRPWATWGSSRTASVPLRYSLAPLLSACSLTTSNFSAQSALPSLLLFSAHVREVLSHLPAPSIPSLPAPPLPLRRELTNSPCPQPPPPFPLCSIIAGTCLTTR